MKWRAFSRMPQWVRLSEWLGSTGTRLRQLTSVKLPFPTGRVFGGLNDLALPQLGTCPAHIVLPCVEHVARGTKFLLMICPKVFGRLNDAGGASIGTESVYYPLL